MAGLCRCWALSEGGHEGRAVLRECGGEVTPAGGTEPCFGFGSQGGWGGLGTHTHSDGWMTGIGRGGLHRQTHITAGVGGGQGGGLTVDVHLRRVILTVTEFSGHW